MVSKTLAAVVLTPVLLLGFGCASDRLLEYHYDQVAFGDTEAHVISLMGEPRNILGAPQNIAWELDATVRPNPGNCVKEFGYRPIINIVVEAYTIGFDAAGNAVSKYHYISQ